MALGGLVTEVFDSSPWRTAGVKTGDVIFRFDNRLVKDDTELAALLIDEKPGKKVKLTIYRDGEKKIIKVRLGTRPLGLPGRAAAGWTEGLLPELQGLANPGNG